MSPEDTSTGTVEESRRLGGLHIFLNYRREDSSGHAGRLYDALAERYGADEVFMDIDKIEPGLAFDEAIEHALGRCDVVLALIGRQWLTIADATGRRRLENPEDFVRLELEEALARGTRLIPLRVQGAEMPGSAELPESIRGLARRHAMELSDTRWRHDVESLIDVLERLAIDKTKREREDAEPLERREAGERLAEETGKQERLPRADKRALRPAPATAATHGKGQPAWLTRISSWSRHPLTIAAAGAVVVALGAVIALPLFGGDGDTLATTPPETLASTSPPTISGTMRAGSTITARPGSWRGAPTTFAYRWRRCDQAGAGCVTVRGATSATYRLTARDVGRRVRVSVTASNDEGRGTRISKATSVVAPAYVRPASSEPPTVSGTPREGSTLVVRAGAWKGTKPISYGYEWRRCDADGADCVAVAGARGLTYTLQSRDVGHRIRVVVRASNVSGRSAATSKATSLVQARPASSGTPTIPSAPKPGPIETVPPALPP